MIDNRGGSHGTRIFTIHKACARLSPGEGGVGVEGDSFEAFRFIAIYFLPDGLKIRFPGGQLFQSVVNL